MKDVKLPPIKGATPNKNTSKFDNVNVSKDTKNNNDDSVVGPLVKGTPDKKNVKAPAAQQGKST